MPLLDPRRQWQSRPAFDVPVTAPSGYTAQGARFNGGAQLFRSALTGIVDGQRGILSFWFKFVGGDGSYQIILETRDQNSIELYRDSTGHIFLNLGTAALGSALSWTSTATFTSAMSGWAHVLLAWDIGGAGVAQAYVNDTAASTPIYSGGATINYLTTDTGVDMGARNSLVIPLNCDIADFYLNTTEYIDISNSTNRAKFISAGRPVDLGSNGQTPTGTSPMIFLHRAVGSWHINDGTGGNFSVVSGALSASSTNP